MGSLIGALTFLARRTVAGVFTVLAMVTVTFVIFWATPTEPAQFLYPFQQLTSYEVAHGDRLLGVDKPKFDQWLDYITHVPLLRFGNAWEGRYITGDQTVAGGLPIGQVVFPALRVTLSLLVGGAVAVLLLAIPLGTYAGRRIGTIGDRLISILVLVGICTHPVVIGILVRALFAGRLHWLPPTGYCTFTATPGGPCGGPAAWLEHLALPWLTFALLFLALYVRMVRASVAETLNEDFVRTARAKGASELRVLSRHVLPNTTSTLATMVGLEIGTALGVCIFIEATYELPGLASQAVHYMAGSTALDLPIILAIVFLLAVVVVVGNLIVDVLYVIVDPRIAFTRERAPIVKTAAGGVI